MSQHANNLYAEKLSSSKTQMKALKQTVDSYNKLKIMNQTEVGEIKMN
jgi:hypothetical protein